MVKTLFQICIATILLSLLIQSASGQTGEQGQILECCSSYGVGPALYNYIEHGEKRVKIDCHIGVDGPDRHYDCYSMSGYASCVNEKEYNKYGIPKTAYGGYIVTESNSKKIIYLKKILKRKYGHKQQWIEFNICLFERNLVSGSNNKKFRKLHVCEDVTE